MTREEYSVRKKWSIPEGICLQGQCLKGIFNSIHTKRKIKRQEISGADGVLLVSWYLLSIYYL
jgi:hypothetical protein